MGGAFCSSCIISQGRQFPLAEASSQKKESSANQSSCEMGVGAPGERTWVGYQRHLPAQLFTCAVSARAIIPSFMLHIIRNFANIFGQKKSAAFEKRSDRHREII